MQALGLSWPRDHPGVAKRIAEGLRRHGAAVDVALDGGQALRLTRAHAYDVAVLDRDLPEVHGDDVCRTLIIEHPGTRVMMLTASRGLVDGGLGSPAPVLGGR